MVITKEPSACSQTELDDFRSLVLAGGEVTARGLEAHIGNARLLIFLLKDTCLIGIAALKSPRQKYKNGVFQKAHATARPNDFPIELGWVFIIPSARGGGLSYKLVKTAVDASKGCGIFATSRTTNVAMHKALVAHGFVNNGQAYASKRTNHELVLFVRDAAR